MKTIFKITGSQFKRIILFTYNIDFDHTYVLWYMQRQGSLAMVSPCISSSKHMTHSPLSSFKTSSANL